MYKRNTEFDNIAIQNLITELISLIIIHLIKFNFTGKQNLEKKVLHICDKKILFILCYDEFFFCQIDFREIKQIHAANNNKRSPKDPGYDILCLFTVHYLFYLVLYDLLHLSG